MNTPVSICGEIASDPIFASLLVGMGASSLSMTSSLLPEVKYLLGQVTFEDTQKLVSEVLRLSEPNDIRMRLEAFRKNALAALV